MTSERVQRQIERFLDETEEAMGRSDWVTAKDRALNVLALDPDNTDARSYLAGAERRLSTSTEGSAGEVVPPEPPSTTLATQPTSFANGRYTVKRFLGEGGKKKVYLAHDSLLDRDVAFALIKTEGLDDAGRQRVQREAQAMGRLGNHPNIVTVYDIGDEAGQPYLVLPILSGGDVEGVIEKAPEHKLPLDQALKIAIETCQGLELAHGKGIVHRDLKPGNVWLTEDGRAMIGDFGLAVAADRSRLTQAGMMVGTVSYMPPEQAMGGEVGPRSDLYSLGAMLYEMVCGRPPFVGDESVAIIGQHLNTPPVAPTWHRPDCPPALEALILRLLEKDPSKRPASATEVREALSSVTSVARPATVVEAISSANDPLYRRTFVGRENEVRQLQQAFDGAMSGNGALVMVVGEPGIGKTAICEQLATYVALRGGKALVGHCYEEGSLSLPYLAFVEAMRSYVLAREPDGLRSDLGTGAADVARIVSEVRDRVQGVELRPAGDPEDDRWRLLQSVTSFLRNASTVQPLVIVLEDLHWADRGTLDLLLHVARNLQGARLLIVGTYRDVEVDRSHPLSNAMGDLRRINNFLRIPLRGLTAEEVQRMMAAVAQREIPWPLAELLHRQTEGSPLFVQEMLRYLVEEGLVAESEGSLRRVGDDSLAGRIPEGLRDVIGKRLTRLGPDANRLLATASVIGRDFRLDVLQRVAAMPEDDIIAALEEAKAAAVVEERSSVGAVVTYRFSHAFFSQTLYEEISAPRRIRLHQQVGRALEEVFARRLDEHAPELAEHFSHSSDAANLSKAVRYGELAAQRAMSVFDYGEAARLLERAIEVQEVLDPDDRAKRCDLLLALGWALIPAGEPLRAAEEVAGKVFALANSDTDGELVCEACWLASRALFAYGGPSIYGTPVYRRWVERYDSHARPGSLHRVSADVCRANVLIPDNRWGQTWSVLQQALELARELGDREVLFDAATRLIAAPHLPEHQEARLRLAEEFYPLDRNGISTRTLVSYLGGCLYVFLEWGFRVRAEEVLEEVRQIAERTRDPAALIRHSVFQARLDIFDGKLEQVVASAVDGLEDAAASGARVNEIRLAGVAFRPQLYLGRANEVWTWLEGQNDLRTTAARSGPLSVFAESPPWEISQRALCLAHMGRLTEARSFMRNLVDSVIVNREAGKGLSHPVAASLLETAVLTQDLEAAQSLFDDLAKVDYLAISQDQNVSLARILGDASVLLGNPNDARRYYNKALEVCAKLRFRPEIALTRLSLAELLLEQYPDERDAAIEHLDFAIAELRDMKMQPALERALRHRGLLKA